MGNELMTKTFTPAVTELDGIGLQPLTPADAPVVIQLLGMRANRFVVDLAVDEPTIAELIATMSRQPWTMPLAATRDAECVGIVASLMPDLKALHASCIALFVDPPEATLPLAMTIRHLFWTFPLRRLHTQIPDMDVTREYVTLLESVGFQVEGRLAEHTVIAGQTFDMVALGLLRTDFEEWCAENEPRLALPSGSDR